MAAGTSSDTVRMRMRRFSKTAGMIAERMGTNFNYMASTAKQAVQRIADVVSGSGRRGGQ